MMTIGMRDNASSNVIVAADFARQLQTRIYIVLGVGLTLLLSSGVLSAAITAHSARTKCWTRSGGQRGFPMFRLRAAARSTRSLCGRWIVTSDPTNEMACCSVVAVFLLALSTTTRLAVAGGYWRFYISVDGKPAFTGGVGVFGDFSPLDHLESSVKGGVQLGTDSYLNENTSGDITLTGDVVFRDQQHPPLHMKQLRLVYERDESDRLNGNFVAGGYYDWRLHPDDAAFIVTHYRREANPAAAIRMATVLGAIAVAGVVSVWLVVWRRKRKRHDQHGCLGPKTA